jgi:hypothetical protein
MAVQLFMQSFVFLNQFLSSSSILDNGLVLLATVSNLFFLFFFFSLGSR